MAFTSPIFRKLLIAAFLLMAGTLLGMNIYFIRFTVRLQTESLHRRLNVEADVLAGEAASVPPSALENWSREAQVRSHARVAIINPQGMVLADSLGTSNVSVSRADFVEVKKALQGATGISVRSDPELNQEQFYLAAPLVYQGRPGYALQLAAPMTDATSAAAALHEEIWIASLVALLLALGIAYFISRSFTRRVKKLKTFAENLGKTPSAQR